MRRGIALLLSVLLLGLTGCTENVTKKDGGMVVSDTQAQNETETTAEQTQTVPSTTAKSLYLQDLPRVDVDLAALTKTMMYAQVSDMIYNPDTYIGKSVRISGPLDVFADEVYGQTHYVCLIEDATACCTQGIEFDFADKETILPPTGTIVTVSGTFDTYMIDMFLYCVLRNAELEYPLP